MPRISAFYGTIYTQRRTCSPTGSSPSATSRCMRSTSPAALPSLEQLVNITGVEVVGDYRLRLTFQDGMVGEVDFAA